MLTSIPYTVERHACISCIENLARLDSDRCDACLAEAVPPIATEPGAAQRAVAEAAAALDAAIIAHAAADNALHDATLAVTAAEQRLKAARAAYL